MVLDLLLDAVVDRVLSPLFDRMTGVVAAIVLLAGCVLCFALWWLSRAVVALVLSGVFAAAAAVSLINSRRR